MKLAKVMLLHGISVTNVMIRQDSSIRKAKRIGSESKEVLEMGTVDDLTLIQKRTRGYHIHYCPTCKKNTEHMRIGEGDKVPMGISNCLICYGCNKLNPKIHYGCGWCKPREMAKYREQLDEYEKGLKK